MLILNLTGRLDYCQLSFSMLNLILSLLGRLYLPIGIHFLGKSNVNNQFAAVEKANKILEAADCFWAIIKQRGGLCC